MTEIRGQCPSHSGDTGGSDSYFWNPDKKQGHCKSCDLATWEHDGVLYGKRRGKGFKIKSLVDGTPLADNPESGEASASLSRNKDYDVFDDFTPKAVVEKEYQPWRGIAEATLREFSVVSTDDKIIFPYPSGGTKTRIKAEKEFYAKGLKSDELFGMNLFPSGCSKKVTITEGECFTPDAEVFTPSGWVALKDYSGEPVLQVHQDQSAGFTNPIAVVDKHFKGDLVEYVSGSYYSLTTPAHNLVREHPKEGLKKFKANKNSYFNVPRTFSRRDTHADITTLEAMVWVMLSADFTFRKEGDIYGALKKERKATRAKELLDQCGVRYSMNKDARGYWSIFIHRGHKLGFAQKNLPFCLSWHPNKEEILDEVIFWDGNYVKTRNQAEFSSNRKYNIDVVQMLAHSCGYVSTIIYRSNEYGEWMKASILFGKTNSSTQKGYNSVPYSGRVMCLTVETGMLVVRQKGSISISGNCDTLSAWQMLQSGRYINPVVSLPSATPSGKLWEKCKGWLDSFDQIILSLDNDDPGRAVAETFFDLFPGKVYIMDHGSYKDANDFLMNGEAQAYKNAWWSAKKYSPAGFTASQEDWFAAIDVEDPYEYVSTPIKAFNEVARGLVKGGITVVKAPPGTGKSSYLRMLMHDLVVNKEQTVSCLMMEEQKSITARAMATYELKTNVKTKEDAETNDVTEDEVKQALSKVVSGEKFISFEVNPQDPVEDCLKQCRHAITIYDADFIFIDHLQRLAYLSGTDTATSALTELGVKLTELAKRRNVGIICISHVNSDNRTKYASSIEEEAIVLIEMQRDKKSEDYEERNTTYLEVSKNRPYAVTGPAGMLTYDIETDMVTERLGPQEPKVENREDDF